MFCLWSTYYIHLFIKKLLTEHVAYIMPCSWLWSSVGTHCYSILIIMGSGWQWLAAPSQGWYWLKIILHVEHTNKTNMVFSSWKVQACTSNRRGLSDPFSYFNPFFFISLLKAQRHWEKFRLLVLALKAHVEGSPSFGVESLSKVHIFGFLKYVSASNPFWFFTGKMFSEMLY